MYVPETSPASNHPVTARDMLLLTVIVAALLFWVKVRIVLFLSRFARVPMLREFSAASVNRSAANLRY
jgi:hypothetical protein